MLNHLKKLVARLRRGLPWPDSSASRLDTTKQPPRRAPARFSELTHYAVLAGYCKHLKPGGSILDLGCGEGLLHEALESGTYQRYVGVDRSEAAIRRASAREDDKTSFVVEDLGYYIPRDRFDVVIFNGALSSMSSPSAVVQRYLRYLKQHGVFLVALPEHDNGLWSLLDSVYQEIDSVRVSGGPGAEHLCKAYSTRPASGATPRRRSSETPPPAR